VDGVVVALPDEVAASVGVLRTKSIERRRGMTLAQWIVAAVLSIGMLLTFVTAIFGLARLISFIAFSAMGCCLFAIVTGGLTDMLVVAAILAALAAAFWLTTDLAPKFLGRLPTRWRATLGVAVGLALPVWAFLAEPHIASIYVAAVTLLSLRRLLALRRD
jgi:hypothetical protein